MSSESAAASGAVRHETFNGQPVMRLSLANGDTALITLQGAQVISWSTAAQGEHFFLSPRAVWDGQSAVRGGVPICFPQFNQRGPLVKHGFARNLPWVLESSHQSETGDHAQAVFLLKDDPQTRAWWPHGFESRLFVKLSKGSLCMTLDLHNTGSDAFSFTGALHSYLRVNDIAQLCLEGLDGLARWDAVRDLHAVQQGAIRFDGEYDSVFASSGHPVRPMVLRDLQGGASLIVENSASWGNVVVWNPGAALCAQLKDMPEDGHRTMLCVEAACVDEPVTLQPGARWSGRQRLSEH
ncbi:D-hexose-6-phosphate mutarotase [Diaphorobacter sp. HDW4A]|uniref:D-hexose-6-phosphate mutarotase n=1 Tax=Diaphorobacter sp. HDW4A TaxID=2714924 RepID=UPI00140E0243|nr:D-hexose-6-phosphate mutarotase [Diaphorobacter sp. HDW4A]QIL81484.1 D-hexose-6-phosphate mutarotase [Diaphorobacter sp. HDW4A]